MGDNDSKQKQGGGINLRVEPELRAEFNKFCENHGFNQAQGFDHLLQVWKLNQKKDEIPSRKSEIENFERLTKDILDSYINSLKYYENARSNALEEFKGELQKKDEKLEKLQARADALEAENKRLTEESKDARKKSSELEDSLKTKEGLIADLNKTIDSKDQAMSALNLLISDAKAKADKYDALKAEHDACLQEMREAELAHKEELRQAKSDIDQAKLEAKTARITAIAELSESHKKELATVQAKLDERTEELMRVKEELSKLRLETAAGTAKKTTTRKTTKKGEE